MLPNQALLALLAILNRRWAAHVLSLLGQRPARFSPLQQAIAVARPKAGAVSVIGRCGWLVWANRWQGLPVVVMMAAW
ncbi:hypothetical protein [Actinomadura miaoliensis]|uniref:Uncharacterized protein n=1 Tax=Actinomadura miaoliensis TaxID=430685 RepID=A0ABP7WZS9_9ACTN